MRERSSVLTEAVRLTVLSNIIQLLGEKVVFERNLFFVVCADTVKNMGHILLRGLSDVIQDDTWNA